MRCASCRGYPTTFIDLAAHGVHPLCRPDPRARRRPARRPRARMTSCWKPARSTARSTIRSSKRRRCAMKENNSSESLRRVLQHLKALYRLDRPRRCSALAAERSPPTLLCRRSSSAQAVDADRRAGAGRLRGGSRPLGLCRSRCSRCCGAAAQWVMNVVNNRIVVLRHARYPRRGVRRTCKSSRFPTSTAHPSRRRSSAA